MVCRLITHLKAGGIISFLQSILDLAPFGLFQGNHSGVGKVFVFSGQGLNLGIQLLPLMEEFLLGDLTVSAHIQKHFFQFFFLLSNIYCRKEALTFEKYTVPIISTFCAYMKNAKPQS